MKNGNISLKLTDCPWALSYFSSFLVLMKARNRVMGMMARVLVSFTQGGGAKVPHAVPGGCGSCYG